MRPARFGEALEENFRPERRRPPGLAHPKAAVPPLPATGGPLADPVPPAQLGGRGAGVLLLEDADGLPLPEPAPPHAILPGLFLPEGPAQSMDQLPGGRTRGRAPRWPSIPDSRRRSAASA
jgi:hypothetical protein